MKYMLLVICIVVCGCTNSMSKDEVIAAATKCGKKESNVQLLLNYDYSIKDVICLPK